MRIEILRSTLRSRRSSRRSFCAKLIALANGLAQNEDVMLRRGPHHSAMGVPKVVCWGEGLTQWS